MVGQFMNLFLFWGQICFLVVIDQFTKFSLIPILKENGPLSVIDGFFRLNLVYNTGGAFGLFRNYQIICILSALFLITFYILFHKKIRYERTLSVYGYILIGAGAIGNFIDRLHLGAVVDFLDFLIWPVFNCADCFICCGIGFLIICSLFFSIKE